MNSVLQSVYETQFSKNVQQFQTKISNYSNQKNAVPIGFSSGVSGA